MAAKKGSSLGTFFTTLFTSLLAPVLVNVVSGAMHPADNNSAQARPAIVTPAAATQSPAQGKSGAQRNDWSHPWVSAAPEGSGG